MSNRGSYAGLVSNTLDYDEIPSSKYPEGKTYRVPKPDIPTGLKLVTIGQIAIIGNAGLTLDDEDLKKLNISGVDGPEAVQRMTLGTVYDEMLADGVFFDAFRYVFADAFAFMAVSPELANLLRQRLGEALAPAIPGQPSSATSTEPTPPSTDGSSSSQVSTDTEDPTPTPESGQSSSEIPNSTPEA